MDITIHNAELCEKNGSRAWLLAMEVQQPDGTTVRTAGVVPVEAMESRTAEYGLDDFTEAEVLELIIREPYAKLDPASPHSLLNASTLDEAREAYLSAIAASKGGGQLRTRGKGQRRPMIAPGEPLKAAGTSATVLVDSDLDDPVETICAHTLRRPEYVDAWRTIVNRDRRELRRARQTSDDTAILRVAERIKRTEEIG